MFFQTGIDFGTSSTKKISVFTVPFTSFYYLTGETEKGRKIYLIPSHKVLLKRLPKDVKDGVSAKRYLDSEILPILKEKKVIWKLWNEEGMWRVIIAEQPRKLPKGAIWDAEPLALTRAFLSSGFESGEVWDFGKKKTTRVIIKNKKISWFQVFFETLPENVSIQKEVKVLLSGGLSLKKEITEYFRGMNEIRLKGISPEKTSAFGAALWGIVGKHLPAFHSTLWELDQEVLKKLSVLLLGSLSLATVSWIGIKLFTPYLEKKLQIKETEVFRKVYHEPPVVSPLLQVKSMIEERKKENFYKLFKRILLNIPDKAKLISINYDGNELNVKVEVPEEVSKELSGNVSSVKKLPDGTEIVEITFSKEEGEKR